MEQQQQQTSSGFFKMFSHICVYNPFEVIVALVSLCVTLYVISTSNTSSSSASTSIIGDSPSVLFYSSSPPRTVNSTVQDIEHSFVFSKSRFNFWFITALRLIAFLCVLIQFKNQLKKLKSKMIISASITMAILTSYLLTRALIEYYHLDATVSPLLIFDTAIYTLVIIDLKKCYLIFSNAQQEQHHHYLNRDAVKMSIVQNAADFTSKSSLDTFFFVLLVALGNLSELAEIKYMSLFGCVLLMSNYVVFMTVFPALLSLTLQFVKSTSATTTTATTTSRQISSSSKQKQQQQQQQILFPQQQQQFSSTGMKILTNPVLVYVKVLMTVFLVMVHLKSKFFNNNEKTTTTTSDSYSQVLLSATTTTTTTTPFEDESFGAAAQYIFYIECVLLASLNVYILSKLLIIDATTAPAVAVAAAPSSATSPKAVTCSTQTDKQLVVEEKPLLKPAPPSSLTRVRSLDECVRAFNDQQVAKQGQKLDDFHDDEIISLVLKKHVPIYKLESYFECPTRGIKLRRLIIEQSLAAQESPLAQLPYESYDYQRVIGTCCENIVGYVPVPLGLAGPLLVDGQPYYIPMATTEGTLVASTNRGCNALNSNGCGVTTAVLANSMTRAPVIRFPSAKRAAEAVQWQKDNFALLKSAFESTSKYAKLETIKCRVAGRLLYMRFSAYTGDAMGMNMISKGAESALEELKKHFEDAHVVALSGNYCTDKKPSAINWIEGRGKSVVCEATVPAHVVKNVLKTSVSALVQLNTDKNLIGSAMAGSVGGFNAHAANIVAAMFIACGQDPGQVVEGCNCITLVEQEGEDLFISCTMPSLEVGTVGGGTNLEAQAACLKLLGVQGSNTLNPGENASRLACIIAAAVLAGELSLMSALAAGHLVKSHMKYNRSAVPLNSQQGIHGVI